MIRVGDCLALAKELPDNSVDCIVTSPPYWGLRDYGDPCAWGLEPTLAEYLARLVSLFDELRRALKPSGTCWVNMGDSYASNWPCQRRSLIGSGSLENGKREARPPRLPGSLKEKDLIGQPWRLAFALQDAGWYLRSDIVWAKPNPMPESVRDRPTRAHEYVFLLTKSAKYWYDADAIRTPFTDVSIARLTQQNVLNQNGGPKDYGEESNRSHRKTLRNQAEKLVAHEKWKDRFEGWEEAKHVLGGANARTVWDIPTYAYPEAHFATFPPELPRRCISAGCPLGGLVLDPFAGSGTTLMVAVQLGRNALGFEINPEYAEMAERRIASVTPSLFCGD